jgi:uncharacterized protein (DUF302 family)
MDGELTIRVRAPFDTVVAWVVESLREHGFGVLTSIDVRETLRVKLDQRIEPFVILGACNPALASRALAIDRRVGLLLPCNVVVRAEDGRVVVEAMQPQQLVDVTGLVQLEPVASEASRRLAAALQTVADVARTAAADQLPPQAARGVGR